MIYLSHDINLKNHSISLFMCKHLCVIHLTYLTYWGLLFPLAFRPFFASLFRLKTRKHLTVWYWKKWYWSHTINCLNYSRKAFFRGNIGKRIWKMAAPKWWRLLSGTLGRIHFQLTCGSLISRKKFIEEGYLLSVFRKLTLSLKTPKIEWVTSQL